MTLELIPNGDLIFKGPFNVVSTTALKLSNSGNERLAYKIKTTAPKRYCVKPNSGFLDAHSTANVQVMLQPQAAGQPDDRTKHKFMVQWAAVQNNYSDDVENFWKLDLKNYTVHDSKLKCIFADEQPAAVVPNDSYGHRDLDAPSTRATESTSILDNRPQQQPNKIEQATSSSLNQRSVTNPVQYQDRQQVLVLKLFSGYIRIHDLYINNSNPCFHFVHLFFYPFFLGVLCTCLYSELSDTLMIYFIR
jgi:hypothetical protein